MRQVKIEPYNLELFDKFYNLYLIAKMNNATEQEKIQQLTNLKNEVVNAFFTEEDIEFNEKLGEYLQRSITILKNFYF